MSIVDPIRFDPTMETPAPDERETDRGLNETLHGIQKTTAEHYGHAVRGVHAKAHGIVRGTLTVQADLPLPYAQGLFARAGAHPAIVRLSTNAGDILDDAIALPRGLALKVLDVVGERLPGSEDDAMQDFVMVNGPAFGAPDPKAFLGNLKMLAGTTDKAEGAKKLLSAVLHATTTALSAVGIESAKLQQLGGAPQVHPLGETYYGQVPFLYGPYIAKFSLVPVSPGFREVTGATIDTSHRPDAIREDVAETMIEQGGVFELRVQLCTDLAEMPIEDATALWDERASPFVTVATLALPPQASWEHGFSDRADDRLAFSVWRGLAAHRPLGGVNRVRRTSYEKSAAFRGRVNGCPMHEPKALDEVAA